MRYGSLFSGIGGIDLGLDRAGMECRWQVEKDEYCRRVLEKHWPGVPKYGDITTVTGDELERVDLICGGFPCQDVSLAGKRAGIGGTRTGLWSEFIRLVRILRPRIVLMENVPGLLVPAVTGEQAPVARILADLAESGFNAEWDCIPAGAVGSRQIRDRLFIIATTGTMDNINSFGKGCDERLRGAWRWLQNDPIGHCFDGGPWASEPEMGRVAYGVPRSVDRVCKLGNAVVPQIAEWIGRRIMEFAGERVTQ